MAQRFATGHGDDSERLRHAKLYLATNQRVAPETEYYTRTIYRLRLTSAPNRLIFVTAMSSTQRSNAGATVNTANRSNLPAVSACDTRECGCAETAQLGVSHAEIRSREEMTLEQAKMLQRIAKVVIE